MRNLLSDQAAFPFCEDGGRRAGACKAGRSPPHDFLDHSLVAYCPRMNRGGHDEIKGKARPLLLAQEGGRGAPRWASSSSQVTE
jgi:hypothetical protein